MLHQLIARDSEPVALMGGEALLGGRQDAIERSEVGSLGQNSARYQITLGHERLDRHVQIRELGQQPLGDSTHMLGATDPARSCLSERRNRVLNILLCDGLIACGMILAVEDLLEVPPNKLFIGF